jgi:arginine/lysine/ornithine decarboxylase
MTTPILDFLLNYRKANLTRLHMPGHKGKSVIGPESLDITEVSGADVLYRETGIIKESQENASKLFGSQKTLYSAEGCTLAIRGMLTLSLRYAKAKGRSPLIAAARNAHKSFLTSCALLDIEPAWLDFGNELYSSSLTPNLLRSYLESNNTLPIAVYVTSPDYLGNMLDLKGLCEVCKEKDVLLLVDNAHGAYLNFLPDSYHPMANGASMCCDSAHKTLPVLTGGAYLHIGKEAPSLLADWAEGAMSLFSSTSPSYLILASLDACNAYLSGDYKEELFQLCGFLLDQKKRLRKKGFLLEGNEPLKISLMPKVMGYTGNEIASFLREKGFECEFSDPDYVCMMFTPQISKEKIHELVSFLESIPQKEPILQFPPKIQKNQATLSPREALLSPSENVSVLDAEGRILAEPGVTCPPAIPIAVCGEVIDRKAIDAFLYYGIKTVSVKK